MGWDHGKPLGTGAVLDVQGTLVATISGTVLRVAGTPFPQSNIGVMGQDDGVPIGTGTTLNANTSLGLDISGTVLRMFVQAPVSGSIALRDEAAPKGQVTILDFVGAGVTATVSGTYGSISIPGAAGSNPPVSGTVVVTDEGVLVGSVTQLSFDGGLVVSTSGSLFGGNAAVVEVGQVSQEASFVIGTGSLATGAGERYYAGQRTIVALGTLAVTTNRLYALPLIVPRDCSFSAFVFEVTASATGSFARAAIYRDNGNLYPATKVWEAPGTKATTSNAVMKWDTPPIGLQGGVLYWMVIGFNLAPTVRAHAANCLNGLLGYINTLGATQPGIGYTASGTVSAGLLPNTYPGGPAIIAAGTAMPFMALRLHSN